MDAADRAQMDMERAQAEFESRPRHTRPSAMLCCDCGETIEEARRAAVPGCVRCFECAELKEGGRRR